ncbi:hypothetical protein [Shewanella sp.]|uniref:hypothetical protein n=1 Tax=Shewanella sp. TaxID=50422 RepID=UPI003A982132
MLLKALKVVGWIAVEILLPDEEQNPEKKRFMEEHGDGLGGVNYYGKSYTGSEASEAYDRGDFYW